MWDCYWGSIRLGFRLVNRFITNVLRSIGSMIRLISNSRLLSYPKIVTNNRLVLYSNIVLYNKLVSYNRI